MEWEEWEDEYGIYKTRTNEFGITETITEYKQKYWDENPPQEPVPQPPTDIEKLQQENLKLKEEDLNNKEAIAELYLMMSGGF